MHATFAGAQPLVHQNAAQVTPWLDWETKGGLVRWHTGCDTPDPSSPHAPVFLTPRKRLFSPLRRP